MSLILFGLVSTSMYHYLALRNAYQAYETAKGDKNKIPMFLLSSVQTDVTGEGWSRQKHFEKIYKLCVKLHANPLKAVDCEVLSKLSQAVATIEKV